MSIITSISLQRGNVEMQDRAELFRFGERTVLALADGAGGISGGAEAAELFITMVRQAAASLQNTNDCVHLLALIDGEVANRRECGETTGIIIGINRSEIFGASVGDSAAKLIGPNSTDDLTKGQRRKPFLGGGSVLVQGFIRKLVEGTLVVATDGLWNYTGTESIEERTRTCDPTQLAMQLTDLVRFPSGNYPDDVAIIACRISL